MAGEKPHGDGTHAQEQRIIQREDGPNVPAGGDTIRSRPPREPRSGAQQEGLRPPHAR